MRWEPHASDMCGFSAIGWEHKSAAKLRIAIIPPPSFFFLTPFQVKSSSRACFFGFEPFKHPQISLNLSWKDAHARQHRQR